MESVDDPDVVSGSDESPSSSSPDETPGESESQQQAPSSQPSPLRQYVESFDQETMIEMAKIVSLEGAALVERQTTALFGDLKSLQQEMQVRVPCCEDAVLGIAGSVFLAGGLIHCSCLLWRLERDMQLGLQLGSKGAGVLSFFKHFPCPFPFVKSADSDVGCNAVTICCSQACYCMCRLGFGTLLCSGNQCQRCSWQ